MSPVAQPLSVPVHANQLDAVDEVCRTSFHCAYGAAIDQLMLLLITGVIAVVLVAAAIRIRQALPAVREERSRTATEQEAFTRFARAVARLDTTGPTVQLNHGPGTVGAVSVSAGPPHSGTEAVRSAYEETVMAMDHYEEEYGEPLPVHMRHELGEEVATAVGQNQQLTRPLQQALVSRAREAAADRGRLINRVDHEIEALEAADEELTAVAEDLEPVSNPPIENRSFPELTDEWHRLGEHESRLRRLLSRRQESLDSTSVDPPSEGPPSLQAYLYEPLDTHYPILADATDLATHVKEIRRRVLRALTRRA